MAKSTTTCNRLLALILNGTAWAGIADNAAASPHTNLFLSLHTADPGVGNSQLTNETGYTNYARVPVVRTSAGFAVATNTGRNAALVQFAQCGESGSNVTHVAIGTAATGVGNVLYAGPLNSALQVADGIQPQFNPSALTVTET